MKIHFGSNWSEKITWTNHLNDFTFFIIMIIILLVVVFHSSVFRKCRRTQISLKFWNVKFSIESIVIYYWKKNTIIHHCTRHVCKYILLTHFLFSAVISSYGSRCPMSIPTLYHLLNHMWICHAEHYVCEWIRTIFGTHKCNLLFCVVKVNSIKSFIYLKKKKQIFPHAYFGFGEYLEFNAESLNVSNDPVMFVSSSFYA